MATVLQMITQLFVQLSFSVVLSHSTYPFYSFSTRQRLISCKLVHDSISTFPSRTYPLKYSFQAVKSWSRTGVLVYQHFGGQAASVL